MRPGDRDDDGDGIPDVVPGTADYDRDQVPDLPADLHAQGTTIGVHDDNKMWSVSYDQNGVPHYTELGTRDGKAYIEARPDGHYLIGQDDAATKINTTVPNSPIGNPADQAPTPSGEMTIDQQKVGAINSGAAVAATPNGSAIQYPDTVQVYGPAGTNPITVSNAGANSGVGQHTAGQHLFDTVKGGGTVEQVPPQSPQQPMYRGKGPDGGEYIFDPLTGTSSGYGQTGSTGSWQAHGSSLTEDGQILTPGLYGLNGPGQPPPVAANGQPGAVPFLKENGADVVVGAPQPGMTLPDGTQAAINNFNTSQAAKDAGVGIGTTTTTTPQPDGNVIGAVDGMVPVAATAVDPDFSQLRPGEFNPERDHRLRTGGSVEDLYDGKVPVVYHEADKPQQDVQGVPRFDARNPLGNPTSHGVEYLGFDGSMGLIPGSLVNEYGQGGTRQYSRHGNDTQILVGTEDGFTRGAEVEKPYFDPATDLGGASLEDLGSWTPTVDGEKPLAQVIRTDVVQNGAVAYTVDDGENRVYVIDRSAVSPILDDKGNVIDDVPESLTVRDSNTAAYLTKFKPGRGGIAWHSDLDASGQREIRAVHDDGTLWVTPRGGQRTQQWTPQGPRPMVDINRDGTVVVTPTELLPDGELQGCSVGGSGCYVNADGSTNLPSDQDRMRATFDALAVVGELTHDAGNRITAEQAMTRALAADPDAPTRFHATHRDPKTGKLTAHEVMADATGSVSTQFVSTKAYETDVVGAPIAGPSLGLLTMQRAAGSPSLSPQLSHGAAAPSKLVGIAREHTGSTDYFVDVTGFDGKATPSPVASRRTEDLEGTDDYRVVVDKLPNGNSIKYKVAADGNQAVDYWLYDPSGKVLETSTRFVRVPTGDVVEYEQGTDGPAAEDTGFRAGRATLATKADGTERRIPIEVDEDGRIAAVDGHSLPSNFPGELEKLSTSHKVESWLVDRAGNVFGLALAADPNAKVPSAFGRGAAMAVKGVWDLGQLGADVVNPFDDKSTTYVLEHAGFTLNREVNRVTVDDPYYDDWQGRMAFQQRHPEVDPNDTWAVFKAEQEDIAAAGGGLGQIKRAIVPGWDEDPVEAVATFAGAAAVPVLPKVGKSSPRPTGTAAVSAAQRPRFIPSERADGGPRGFTPGGPEVPPTLRGRGGIADAEFYPIDPDALALPPGHGTAARGAGTPPTSPGRAVDEGEPGYYSMPVGRRAEPINPTVPEGAVARNTPTEIFGRPFSGRALDDMQRQNVGPYVVQNALETNGKSKDGRTVYEDTDNKVTVTVDSATREVLEVKAGPVKEQSPGLYSGRLIKVNKPDAHADLLAEYLGAESRMRFENDPKGKEFDAVGADRIGEAKPGGMQVNEKFRDKADDVFRAAMANGKEVYYHFDGPPAPGVREALQRLADRYGVRLTIDERPLAVLEAELAAVRNTRPGGSSPALSGPKPAPVAPSGATGPRGAAPLSLKATGPDTKVARSSDVAGFQPRIDQAKQQPFLSPTARSRFYDDVDVGLLARLAARAGDVAKQAPSTLKLDRSGKVEPGKYQAGKATVRFNRAVAFYQGRPTDTVVVRSNKAGEVYVEPAKPRKPAGPRFFPQTNGRGHQYGRFDSEPVPAIRLDPATGKVTVDDVGPLTENINKSVDDWEKRLLPGDPLSRAMPETRVGKAKFAAAVLWQAIASWIRAAGPS